MIIDGSYSPVEKRLSFADRHPMLACLGWIGLGVVAVAAINGFFYWIGGLKLVEEMEIVPICIGALCVFNGYLKVRHA